MNKAISVGLVPFIFLAIPSTGSASSWHVGLEFGQMAFNGFKHVAGEVGYSFENDHALRIALFNVALSERHLSSNEASIVDGDDVKALWQGIDLYYDYPITKQFFISPSIGYHDQTFTHTVLGTSTDYYTPSAGFALSYSEVDILGIDKLYWRFSVTFGYRFNGPFDATLGDTSVSLGSISMVPALFIGYKFD